MDVRCKVCGEPIVRRCVVCPECETPHHQDCWSYSGGCAVYGCRKAAPTPLPGKSRPRDPRWAIAAAVLALVAGALAYLDATTPPPKPFCGLTPPVRPVAPASSRPPPPPSPPSPPPTARRITPPTREAIVLEHVFVEGQPTSAADAVNAAFPKGHGELKVVSMSLAPAGAYVVAIPPIGNTAALGGARVRVHLAVAERRACHAQLVARPVLEDWAYHGRGTPLPAIGSKPLETVGALAWDVTALVGDGPARVAILPRVADFDVLREMRQLEGRTVAWMSVGDPVPAAPAPVRALPDLAITGMELMGDEVRVHFENRGNGTWSRDRFEISLGLVDGPGVLGSSDGALVVPAPEHMAMARFSLGRILGTARPAGKTMFKAEIDWSDKIPESEETNNVAKRELDLP